MYEKQRKYVTAQVAIDPEWGRKRLREWRIKNGRSKDLRDHYGMTSSDRDALLQEQNWLCLVCNGPFTHGKNKPVVDHCHKTGRVRGIVHFGCNTAIGLLKDSPEICRAAALYLERDGKRFRAVARPYKRVCAD